MDPRLAGERGIAILELHADDQLPIGREVDAGSILANRQEPDAGKQVLPVGHVGEREFHEQAVPARRLGFVITPIVAVRRGIGGVTLPVAELGHRRQEVAVIEVVDEEHAGIDGPNVETGGRRERQQTRRQPSRSRSPRRAPGEAGRPIRRRPRRRTTTPPRPRAPSTPHARDAARGPRGTAPRRPRSERRSRSKDRRSRGSRS